MSMYIAEDKIADIKNAADIIEIIADYVVLKKTGKNYVGLCPFHSEKTPSFTVSSEKQIFHCFGCGEGGNVFTFLMKKDGLSFPEAIRFIGKRYGIEIPEKTSKGQKRHFDERETLYSINEQTKRFYKDNLHDTNYGKAALRYLKKRGLTDKIIDEFDLGYAPEGWSNLFNYFSQKEISYKIVHKAGLIVNRKQNTGYYDRFRRRIIFPILDGNKRIIGFGGRVMDDSLPKYLNSPETPVFNKSTSLYGINKAKQKCRDSETVYIVEGYFDLLALHQHDIQNSVATLGTSLTTEHVQLLRNRYIGKNGNVILVFDSDDAGLKAAKRSIGVFKQSYVDAKILVLPDGFDPDSFLFQFGRQSFLEIAAKASSAIVFLTDFAVKRYGLSIEGKKRILSEVISYLAMVEDDVTRSLYIKELAERLGIDEAAIAQKLHDMHSLEHQKVGAKNGNVSVDGKGFYETGDRLERYMITMMLQYPDILPEITKRDLVEQFQDTDLKLIGQLIVGKMESGNDILSEVLNTLDDVELINRITALAMGDETWNHHGCLKLIQQFEKSRSRYGDDLLQRIKTAEDNNDNESLLKLLKEKQAKATTYKNDLEFLGGKSK